MSGEDKGSHYIESSEADASELPPFDDPQYRKHLEGQDITEEQMVELLRIIDSIMRTFVDLGFGVDAVQLALPALAEFASQPDSGTVTHTPSCDFNNAATGGESPGAGANRTQEDQERKD